MRQFSGKVVMRVRESHGALSNVTAAVLASMYWGGQLWVQQGS